MNQLHTAPTVSTPTHDEIALHAFLIWEKEGRQPGREQTYWLQAEEQLRLTRQQLAEQASNQSSRPWPPPAAGPKLASARAVKPSAPKITKLRAASRGVAEKPATTAKPLRKAASSVPVRKSLARN